MPFLAIFCLFPVSFWAKKKNVFRIERTKVRCIPSWPLNPREGCVKRKVPRGLLTAPEFEPSVFWIASCQMSPWLKRRNKSSYRCDIVGLLQESKRHLPRKLRKKIWKRSKKTEIESKTTIFQVFFSSFRLIFNFFDFVWALSRPGPRGPGNFFSDFFRSFLGRGLFDSCRRPTMSQSYRLSVIEPPWLSQPEQSYYSSTNEFGIPSLLAQRLRNPKKQENLGGPEISRNAPSSSLPKGPSHTNNTTESKFSTGTKFAAAIARWYGECSKMLGFLGK